MRKRKHRIIKREKSDAKAGQFVPNGPKKGEGQYHEISLRGFDKYYSKLVDYYGKHFDEGQDKARETFEKDITQQIMECASHNRSLNLKRTAYIIRFIKMLPFYPAVLVLFYVFLLIDTPRFILQPQNLQLEALKESRELKSDLDKSVNDLRTYFDKRIDTQITRWL